MIRSEHDWLESARALVLRSDSRGAKETLRAALNEYPGSFELRRAMAGVCQHFGETAQAEKLFQELHTESPEDEATSFELARLLMSQGRMGAMASVLLICMRHGKHNAEAIIRAVEMLDGADRICDAAALCEEAIAAMPDDVRLHAYAGMLLARLGEFERARDHFQFTIHNSPYAVEWRCPLGLANTQRYLDDSHPDFVMFRGLLEQADLSGEARATLLFALGKAHDDIADYTHAAEYLRQANSLAHETTRWSRKSWRRSTEALLSPQSYTEKINPTPGFSPIFIVGMPRSGTTLVAELLSKHAHVCNRGESEWIAKIAQKNLFSKRIGETPLREAAVTYAAHTRQDDRDAHWFIDKQPLNLRYVDLILALFTNAKIIYCERNPRDTALSLWMQWFVSGDQGYAYDFKDIAAVMRDCKRLMTHWQKRFAGSIRSVRYEHLVSDPVGVVADLAQWLELPTNPEGNARETSASIRTASLWQARQPIHSRSVGRWKHYAADIPELMEFPVE